MNFKKGEVLFFNKPFGWTSFKVVGHARYHICRRIGVKKLKVGHAGTLDPLATGVMIVCTGKATKRIEEFQYHTKEYVATLRLGATTPSYDLEHEIDATYPTEHITRELVEEVLTHFIGAIDQVPPAFSACMVDGKRAYELARKGEEVELKAKQLVIDEIELLECRLDDPEPMIQIRVVCSKGTYIRALARDIGEALHSGAHLTGLIRTRVGDVRLEDCLNPEHFKVFGIQTVFQPDITYTGTDQSCQVSSAMECFADVAGQGADISPFAAYDTDLNHRFRIIQATFQQFNLVDNKLFCF